MNEEEKVFLEMLTYKRPAGSKSEQEFLERYIKPLKPTVISQNLLLHVPGDLRTLFSCHTDTVHWQSGMQQVLFDAELGIAYKDEKSTDALGGDNTCGVWMLLQMIAAKIPGVYAFHYGEEKGCIGSKQMAREYKDWISQFDRAIAFDRRKNTSIITYQMGSRTCSDIFAKELAKRIGLNYAPDTTGLYTDTASYRDIIPECTNVSVGYDHEHSSNEIVDVNHLFALRDAIFTVKFDDLPVVRDPKAVDTIERQSGWARRNGSYYGAAGTTQGTEYGGYGTAKKTASSHSTPDNTARTLEPDDDEPLDLDFWVQEAFSEVSTLADAEELCRSLPLTAAKMLYALTYPSEDGVETASATVIPGASNDEDLDEAQRRDFALND